MIQISAVTAMTPSPVVLEVTKNGGCSRPGIALEAFCNVSGVVSYLALAITNTIRLLG